MKKNCYVLYAIDYDKCIHQMVGVDILNAFETEAQGIAAMRYESDLAIAENCVIPHWISDNVLRIPATETGSTYSNLWLDSVDYHEKDVPHMVYPSRKAEV